MDVELRVASRHFREHGSKLSGADGKRHGNSQTAAKITGGQDRFLGHFDFRDDFGCMVSKRNSGFRESGATGGSCEKLDAKLRFKPEKPPTDNRLGYAEPARGGRNAPGISNFHECLQLFDIQFSVPHSATQRCTKKHYRIMNRNASFHPGNARAAHTSQQTNLTHNSTKG